VELLLRPYTPIVFPVLADATPLTPVPPVLLASALAAITTPLVAVALIQNIWFKFAAVEIVDVAAFTAPDAVTFPVTVWFPTKLFAPKVA
jgi:hypothetical protein